jgi:hypothetical protein
LAEHVAAEQRDKGSLSGVGIQIQFVSQPDVELAFESLAYAPQRIELLSVRRDGSNTVASVFVPDGKLAHFEKYVLEYLDEKKDARGIARDHAPLMNTIQSIRAAEIRALWTDDPSLLPNDVAEEFWWEVWLPVRSNADDVIQDFRCFATAAGCVVGDRQARFPERTVLLMHGSQARLSSSVLTLNCIAELRRAKDTAEFFDGMALAEQREWLEELKPKLQLPRDGDEVQRICLLDTGVNRGHPLLSQLMAEADMHSVNPAWGTADDANHGTVKRRKVVTGLCSREQQFSR